MSTVDPRPDSDKTHWLGRPETRRRLWIAFAVLLAASVLAQVLVHVHAYFAVDGWFGFNAAYGFLTCVGMVLFAKLLGLAIKRPDHYYESAGDLNEKRDDA